MRRAIRSLILVSLIAFAACMDDPASDPVGPPVTDTALGKKGPAGCLSPAQQALSDEILDEIGDLFSHGGSRNAATQHVNNIDRKLCDGDYADALDKAFGYLQLLDGKYPRHFDGTAAAAAEHISQVFALVAAAPNPAPSPFEIPPGAFDPETGGIITFDPDAVTLPFVAGTGNNEAAVVLDEPGIFPPGTGPVTIILSRAPGGLVTTFGAFIPGFQAFEEGYEIISSHQPWDMGPGILVAICGVPPLPADAAIGHLHDGEVSLLVPTDPDPQALGYIDCSDVEATSGGAPVLSSTASPGWLQLARRVVDPVVTLLEPPPLKADILAFGPGLGGRTNSLSSDAPVDPVIGVDESVQLSVGTDASWDSEDDGIATVDSDGLVTGVCPGTTLINASFGEESSLSIRITVIGEGECSEELPEPILEQTGSFESDGVVYELSLTNADDYADLFDAEEYPACTEGTDAPLELQIWEDGGEGPADSFCVESLSDLESFTLYDSQASIGSPGMYEDIYVVLYSLLSEESVTSNSITLNPDGCPC